jgi:hypothetical protein
MLAYGDMLRSGQSMQTIQSTVVDYGQTSQSETNDAVIGATVELSRHQILEATAAPLPQICD